MPESYAANTAARRIVLGPAHTEVRYDSRELVVLREVRPDRLRIVPLRPLRRLPAVAADFLTGGTGCVEDSFGTLSVPDGLTTRRLPVMARPAGPVPPAPRKADLEISRVTDREGVEAAEGVIVHGAPRPSLWPFTPGRLLPPHTLTVPGLRVWLARRQRVPAAACLTYDDGATVGVYSLVTLPEQRGRGIARLLLARALADYGDRRAVLTATPQAVPICRDLGFDEVSEARWHTWS